MAEPSNAIPSGDRIGTPVNKRLDLDLEKGSPEGSDSDFDAAPTIVESDRGSTREYGEKNAGINAADEEDENRDPNVVSWDGPHDPENPMKWTDRKKWAGIGVLSIMTLVT